MNPAHLHLLLNHIPLPGILLGLALLLVALSRNNDELKKLSCCVFLLIALLAVPVYLTGEGAEEIVEHLPGVEHELIEEHEESALVSLVAIEVLGLLSLAGLIRFRGPGELPHWFVTTCLLLSIVVAGMVAWTSNLGGRIRHSETRPGFQSSSTAE